MLLPSDPSMHSGSAPRDLRTAYVRPANPGDTVTAERLHTLLLSRGDDDIAAMLFDPMTNFRPPAHRSRAQLDMQTARAREQEDVA